MKSRNTVYWGLPCAALVIAFLGYGFFNHLFFPANAFGGGDGSAGNPYQITNCTDFQAISSNLSANYIISNNFSCSGVSNWASLGTFSGVLDGNDKTISDFTGSNVQGIFTGISEATIKDLNISNVQFNSPSNEYVGALAGSGGGTTTNVHVLSGSITGYNIVGGLYGNIEGGTVTDSSSAASVTGVNFVGGLAGRAVNAPIDGCYTSGSVTSTGNPTGGLVGYCTGAISNSHASGDVVENNPTAGDQWATGGLAGFASGGITNSYATGDVDSYWEAGGLVGWAENGTVSNCYATGNIGSNITTGTRIGGFVGAGLVDISNSYATGSVRGSDAVGGFAGGFGWGGRTLSYVYSNGAVTGSTNVGGLVGDIQGTVSSTSYYDSQTSGQSDTGKGTPKTTAEMKTQSTFTDWDFGNIWDIDTDGVINSGYPFLLDQSVASNNATVSSSTYTVSAGGTANETITNVPYSTSKATFLAALHKVNDGQTWNTTNVSDPVVTNNTLVVTAEDGVTVVTYTITVNAELNHIATITSSTYIVSAGGTSEETINGVEPGTDKATFLAALTKGNENQTWDDDDIQDPVVYGDTLVVTAEDGVATVTYTVAVPPFSGEGSGTSVAPYEITTCAQLEEVQNYLTSEFIVKNDINCAETSTWNGGIGFMPIGTDPGSPFNGVFDGNGKTISNVVINKPFASGGAFVGFFGDVENGLVKDLTLANISVTAEHYQFVGGLVGAIMLGTSTGVIDNVHVSGSVIGSDYVGGMLGITYTKLAEIQNSSADVDVQSGGYAGGLVGMGMLGIDNSSASGDVVGVNAGGLVGYTQGSTSSIQDSHASGAVQGSQNAGGLIGKNTMKIENCYAEGDVEGEDDYVGGLIGMAYASNSGDLAATINNSYATGDVSGDVAVAVGGLIGWCNANVSDSHATGHVTSTGNIDASGGMTSVGGLLALTFNNISNSYATGNVEGDAPYVGGLIGIHYGSNGSTLTGSYATGNVTATTHFLTGIGGLTGTAFGPIYSSYSSGSVTMSGTGDSNSGVGGLSGLAYGLVYDCHSNGDVLGTSPNVGGLIGKAFSGVTDSFALGDVSSSAGNVGGLAGWSNAAMERDYATGNVLSTGDNVGGLVGMGVGSYVSKSYSLGEVNGVNYVGGLIGAAFTQISDTYSFSKVTGTSGVGGLVGGIGGSITNSYSKGLVQGSEAGGLLGKAYEEEGYPAGTITVTSSYYNSQTSGQSDTGKGTPINNTQMGLQSTYVGWNFYNLWTLGMDIETSSSPSGGGTTAADAQNLGNPIFKTQTGEATVTATPASGYNFLYWTENGTVVSTNPVYKFNYQSDGGYSGEAGLIEISTCQELQDINLNMSGLYTLSGDIDCTASSTWNSGAGFIPLGKQTSTPFTGLLEGANHTIKNLTINIAESDYNIGIFQSIEGGGVVKNLNIENITINTPASSYVGALTSSVEATMGSSTSISNVHVTSGSVTGDQYVGGLIGGVYDTTIELSSSAANVTGSYSLGGLIGNQSNGNVVGCYATGAITGSGEQNGGLVGQASGTIDNSYATGVVSGAGYSGGLVGSSGAIITNSYATGAVNSSGQMVGGLVGNSSAMVSSSYATGTVTGTNYVGGLVGYATKQIEKSYATGDITGVNYIGGLVGDVRDATSLSNSYAMGDVEGEDTVGGLAGEIYGTLTTNTFSKGSVTGTSNVGGFAGSYYNSGVLPVSSYYDSQTSGMSDTDSGTPKTTAQMKTQSTYTNWDFSTIWSIASGVNEGYPAFIVTVPEPPAPPAPPAQECMIERDFSTAHNPPCEENEAGYDDENGVKKCADIVSITCSDVEGGEGETTVITRRLVANFAPTYIPPVEPDAVSITNLNTSMSATDTGSSLDVTIPSTNFKGAGRNIRLYFGSGLTRRVIANVITDLTTSRSWANVEGLLNLTTKKVLVHNLASAPGAAGKYDMYVPKGTDDNRVLVCPDATTLSAVKFGCTDGYILTSNQMTSSVISGSTYWVIPNLTGTGAMSYQYVSEEPPIVTPDEPETPEEEIPDGDIVIPDEETPNTQEEVKDIEDSEGGTTIKDVVAVLSTFSKDVAKVVKELPISETASQNITAATLAVIIVSPAVSVGIGSSYTIAYVFRFFSMIFAFFGFGRKKRNCGLVYDSVTKEPIKNAIVRIYNLKNTLVATEVTNMYGIFETDIESGQYSILVQANNFKFPSILISGVQDYPYNNIYKGGNFSYDAQSNISYSIPLDPLDKSNTEYVGAIARNRFVKWTSILMNLFVLLGLVFSVIAYIKSNTTLNLILLIVYILLIVISMIIRQQDKYKFGTVVNMMEEPQQGVQIGLMEMEFNTTYAKRITNEKGKYRFIVPGGEYKLISLDPNYEIDGKAVVINGKKKKILSISKNISVVRRT